MVAPMFKTFSLHWLFCYLFLCDLRHIYHLPIHFKVIKVIKLMQGYLMCKFFVRYMFFLLSNDQAASIRVDRLCLINLALSNHHDLTKIK